MELEQFTSEYECDALIVAAQNQMQDSCVLDPTSGEFVFMQNAPRAVLILSIKVMQ